VERASESEGGVASMKRSTRETLIALTPSVVGGSALGVIGVMIVRACVAQGVLASSNDVVGNYLQTLGSIYAVLLAFVVVIVWQQFNDARTQVEREANEIADLFRMVQGFSDPQRARISASLARYVDAVLTDEWTAMRAGDEVTIDRVGAVLDDVSDTLHSFDAPSTCQQALHAEALSAFNDLSDARASRLTTSRLRIPRALRWLLYVGGFVLIASTWIFAVDSFAIHAIISGALAGAVSHILYVIEDLDDSFGGNWQVPRESFEHLRAQMKKRLARTSG
jgi:hypothetical protein